MYSKLSTTIFLKLKTLIYILISFEFYILLKLKNDIDFTNVIVFFILLKNLILYSNM
jgi:hypothetical protein